MRRPDNLTTLKYWLPWNLGRLNFLEPSGSVKVCNGTALAIHFTSVMYGIWCCCYQTSWRKVSWMCSVSVDDTGRGTLPRSTLHHSLLIFLLAIFHRHFVNSIPLRFFFSFLLYIRAGEIFSARCALHQKLQIQSAVSRFCCALLPTDDFNEIFSSVRSFVLHFFSRTRRSEVGIGYRLEGRRFAFR